MIRTVSDKKRCSHCGEFKELSLFRKRTDGGMASWCIACTNIGTHEWYLRNKADINKHRRNNREKLRVKERIY